MLLTKEINAARHTCCRLATVVSRPPGQHFRRQLSGPCFGCIAPVIRIFDVVRIARVGDCGQSAMPAAGCPSLVPPALLDRALWLERPVLFRCSRTRSEVRPRRRPLPAAAAARNSDSDSGSAVCYFATLGVQRTASRDEIKQAYRRLAREWHPDVNRSPHASERFKVGSCSAAQTPLLLRCSHSAALCLLHSCSAELSRLSTHIFCRPSHKLLGCCQMSSVGASTKSSALADGGRNSKSSHPAAAAAAATRHDVVLPRIRPLTCGPCCSWPFERLRWARSERRSSRCRMSVLGAAGRATSQALAPRPAPCARPAARLCACSTTAARGSGAAPWCAAPCAPAAASTLSTLARRAAATASRSGPAASPSACPPAWTRDRCCACRGRAASAGWAAPAARSFWKCRRAAAAVYLPLLAAGCMAHARGCLWAGCADVPAICGHVG